jgi:hypothetical protein
VQGKKDTKCHFFIFYLKSDFFSKKKFQNGYNKVVIELRVVQLWSEIKLAITNCTMRSCNFVITRLISDQIALHSVQLPLFIVISS